MTLTNIPIYLRNCASINVAIVTMEDE